MGPGGAHGAPLPSGSAREVFGAFLRLGLTSFGGPVAHLGYFRRELVQRRRWVDEARFAELVTLCQFLPGPASSQLGFALGLTRAGWTGALAAFFAFALPSAVALYAFALALPAIPPAAAAVLVHGLKLAAVAVVAQALIAMARSLCPDVPRALLALGTAFLMIAAGAAWMQVVLVAAGALAGLALRGASALPRAEPIALPHGHALGAILLAAYAGLLVALPIAAAHAGGALARFAAFYRSGALVFGGGHVVLPLLEEALVRPGWIARDEFLAGYGAAQAIPGPLFTIASFLGARMDGAAGAIEAVGAIFLPGLLLVAGALPFWRSIAAHPAAGRAVAGASATVVGLLAAAFVDPVCTSAVHSIVDAAIAAGARVLLFVRIAPPWAVAACVAASVVEAVFA
jgi:chromate transporter